MVFDLISLFASTFIAATIFPAIGMPVIFYVLSTGFSPETTILIATVGNFSGACFSQIAGHYFSEHKFMKYLGKGSKNFDKAQGFTQKHRHKAALLTGLPALGDRIPLALGLFKIPLKETFLSMLFAKTSRYVVIVFGFEAGVSLFN